MFWRTCVPVPPTAADIDCCEEHVCAVHTVHINANFFSDSIMSLSTNVIQRAESFLMLPAVNWRYTFSTAWRQHKSIIFTLSATRCSSLSIDGYTDISTRYCGHWGTRASRIKESVPPPAKQICVYKQSDNGILRAALSLTHCTFVLSEKNVPRFPSLHLHPCKVQFDSLKHVKRKYFSPLYPKIALFYL